MSANPEIVAGSQEPATLRVRRSVTVKAVPHCGSMVLESGTVVSEKPQDRATSHAKSVDLVQQQNALDRALNLREQFERAKAAQQSLEQQQSRPPEKQGHTSHVPLPAPSLRPQDATAKVVDGQAHQRRQSMEDQRSRTLSEGYKARLDQQKMLGVDHERDKDNTDRS